MKISEPQQYGLSASLINDMDELLSWAKHNGSLIHPAVDIYSDDLTGLSFRAVDEISRSTHLVDCAYESTLSYLNAIQAAGTPFSLRGSESFPDKFILTLSQDDANVIGYFFLIQQYLMRERSFWWKYIKLLPQPNEPERLAVPVLWPERDQRFLEGTNAEPAIRKRNELWKTEWSTAVALLQPGFPGWEDYTFALYRWAAAIFGSRSFRPSLTVSPEVLDSSLTHKKDLLLEQVARDSFSILLPVLDIGNHNGLDEVDWSRSPTSFRLLNKSTITKGSQIYNFYGSKSNSELLVAYGFLLPQAENDKVNLKINPPHAIQQMRRSQASHTRPSEQQADEEFMFTVGFNSRQSLLVLSYFSDGLFDTTVCMVANAREREWIPHNLDYSPERDPSVFRGPLARGAHQALVVLKAKLEQELARLQKTHPGTAQNYNQRLALEYRTGQEEVLKAALPFLSEQIASTIFTSLDTAFAWLKRHYPILSTEIEALISEDQEETLPLNWDLLAEDWNFTYLVTWVYIVLSLKKSEPPSFKTKHPSLSLWLSEMQNSEANSDDQLFADKSELETIDSTIGVVANRLGHDDLCRDKMRNLASCIVKEEAVRSVNHHGETPGNTSIPQDVLCIQLDS